MKTTYPFSPKSNRSLLPGQFWSISLTSGRFACGRVLDVPPTEEKQLREFYAGLMDWVGDNPPTAERIAGSRIIEQGLTHIKTITARNAMILGCRPLELDQLQLPFTVAQSCWQPGAVVMQGYQEVRASYPEEHPWKYISGPEGIRKVEQSEALPVQSTWGYNFIYLLAEKHFGHS
ncbi:Imm26 family immunity protein [Hymenobacter gummosus]|nr:Imm26 family immunity protein [Hymenobacter gummosus]